MNDYFYDCSFSYMHTHTNKNTPPHTHRYIPGEHRVRIWLYLFNIHILRRDGNTKYLKYAMQNIAKLA